MNVKYPAEWRTCPFPMPSASAAMQNEMVKWSGVSSSIHGKISEAVIEQKPSEIAGEAKILYALRLPGSVVQAVGRFR